MMSVSTLRAHSIHTSPIIAQINTCTMAAIMDANTILLALQESHQWEVDDFTVMLFDDPSSDTPVEVNLKDWVKSVEVCDINDVGFFELCHFFA
jgi:hypothetical protein